MTVTDASSTRQLSDQAVADYRRDGFTVVRSVLTANEVEHYRRAAAEVAAHGHALNPGDPIFTQVVNVWRSDQVLAGLTLHPVIAQLATQLAGVPLRLWHDHLLAKKPHNQAPTEYHQDAPYWPHTGSRHCLSAWVALVDVPVERGCMTFIPGAHRRSDIRAVDLSDPTDLFEAAPELAYEPRVTVPLRAGDVTFHNGYTPHTANSNDTDDYRYAFVTVYIDRETAYDGRPHVVTDPLDLEAGEVLPDTEFPPLP